MKKLLSMFENLIFCCVVFFAPLLQASFAVETLVKTSFEHITIDRIARGDDITCVDVSDYQEMQSRVTAVHQRAEDRCIRIVSGGTLLKVSREQKFYLPLMRCWCEARYLRSSDFLLKLDGGVVAINDLQEVRERVLMCDISVDKYHTFCVSEHNIVVHNVIFTVPIASWGAGVAWFKGVTVAKTAMALLAGAACVLLEKMTGKRLDPELNANGSINGVPLPGIQEDSPAHPTVEAKISRDRTGGNQCPCGHLCDLSCCCGCFCGCGIRDYDGNGIRMRNDEPIVGGFSEGVIEEAVKYAMNDRKIEHIFDKPMHKLDPLVAKLGGHECTIRAVLAELNKTGIKEGIFEDVRVCVAGYDVYVRGRVINGVPKIGTFFVK